MNSKLLTVEELSRVLTYDPQSGELTWLVSVGGRGRQGHSGKFPAGTVAGSSTRGSYCRIRLNGRIYYGHRIAWALTYGSWPTKNIDHIDGNPTNNKLANLREVSQQQNIQNQRRALPNNTSGLLGVGWHNQAGKWRARITVGQKSHHLGLFDTPDTAHEAYLEAKRKLHEGCTI